MGLRGGEGTGSSKYIKCFDNREPHVNACVFEQVYWYKDLKEAKRHFKIDERWAKEHGVTQYIFKILRKSGEVEKK